MSQALSTSPRCLVTGGTGFIGSHQVVALLDAGFEVAVVDDLSNSWESVLERIRLVTGKSPQFWKLDVRQTESLRAVVAEFQPDSVIHFAGRKHVWESTTKALQYYDSNVGGLLSLLAALQPLAVRNIVFSSSGSVYGPTDKFPIPESQPHNPTNPYSSTKSICERILHDLCAADPSWSAVALRYFNPAGAHQSGLLGEWCVGRPSNLMPSLIEAALSGDAVAIHGTDHQTPDGSGVRDYVHVEDVAEAHLRAINLISDKKINGFQAINIGRGIGVSVLELVQAVEHATGRTLVTEVGPARPGDVATLYGDTTRAAEILDMTDYRSTNDMCVDAWRFRTRNRDGYATIDLDPVTD